MNTSVENRHAATGTKPRPKAQPLGLAWCHAGTVKRTTDGWTETLPYVTLRDFSRYPGPKLRELAKRLPRRLRTTAAAQALAA